VHRNYNADEPQKMLDLVSALEAQTENFQVVFPVHPRTAKGLNTTNSSITFLPPVSYFDMLALEKRATMILTDSGGVQKEAFFFKKPLVILRSETEWTELLEYNVAVLCRLDTALVSAAIKKFEHFKYPVLPNLYGDGFAAEKICKTLINGLA
jgi:UDP-GlcNAc3NAcA epimerase